VKVVHNATGKIQEVDEQTARQGLESGDFALQKGQTVDILDNTTGDLKKVTPDQLGQEFARGNEIASASFVRQRQMDEKHGGFGDTALAGLEGAGRGLTFGATDYAARKLAPELANEMAERKEAHPIASTVGEIGGAVAPMVLSGGTGAVAKGAALAPTSLVGRAGSAVARGAETVVGTEATGLLGRAMQRAIPMAAQGAVEGAAYGAGQVVSENSLGDKEITAEKLLAGAEHGMFLGGAVGGGLGVATELGKAAAQKAFKFAGEGSLKTWLQDVADHQTIRALGGGIKARNVEGAERRVSEIAETVRNATLDDGTKVFKPFSNASELAEKLAVAESQAGNRLSKVVDKIEDITRANPEARPDVNRFLKKVDDEFLDAMKASREPEVRRRAERIESSIERFRPQPVEAAPEVAPIGKPPKSAASGEVDVSKAKLEPPNVADFPVPPAPVAAPEPLTFKELRQARMDLDSAIYQERASAASGIPNLPNPKLQAMERTRGLLEEEIERSADAASKLVGDEALAAAYHSEKRAFRDLRQAKEMAEQWQMRDFRNRATSPTDYLTGIGSGIAAASGGLGGLASLGTGMLASAAHNVIRERGNSVLAYAAERLANTNALSHVVAGVDQKIEAGVRAALRTELPRVAVQTSTKQAEFNKLADKVAAVQANPAEHVAQKVGGLSVHAPGLAAAASNVIAQDMQYVAEKMPKRAVGTGMTGHIRGVSDADSHKAQRIVKAIDKPLTVLKDIKSQRLTPSVAAAVRDRRPEIMQNIELQIATGLASGKRPSWETQKQLTILTGKPVSFQQSPAFKASMQQIYQQQNQAGGGAPAPSRRPATKLAAGQLTPSQKLNFE
jgi:hypothetical protein